MYTITPPQGRDHAKSQTAVLALASKVLKHQKAGHSYRASFYRGRMESAKQTHERRFGPIVTAD